MKELEKAVAQLQFLDNYVNHFAEKEKLEMTLSSFTDKLNRIKQLKKILEDTDRDYKAILKRKSSIAKKLRNAKITKALKHP